MTEVEIAWTCRSRGTAEGWQSDLWIADAELVDAYLRPGTSTAPTAYQAIWQAISMAVSPLLHD